MKGKKKGIDLEKKNNNKERMEDCDIHLVEKSLNGKESMKRNYSEVKRTF